MSLIASIGKRFGDAIRSSHGFRGDETVVVGPETLPELAAFVSGELALVTLTDIAGVDGLHLGWKPRFEVVYHFFAFTNPGTRRLRVKVQVAEESPHVPSLAARYKSAGWLERECWDQFGIVFDGHPDLRRILNHEEFVGHPLRKDYPVDGRQVLRRATDLD